MWGNLLGQSVGRGDSVYDWELGASFGNFHDDEVESLNEAFGGVHLSEQSEDTGDNVSEFGSLLSHGSTQLRNQLIKSRGQTSTPSTSTGNRNKAPRISKRSAKISENDQLLHSLGLFTNCVADNVKSLTEAVAALKNSPQRGPYHEYTQTLPWAGPKMELSVGGKVSVKDYIIFQRTCLSQIRALGLSPAKALVFLQNYPHCLPKDMRNSVRLCTTLDGAFRKLASYLPNRDIAVVTLKRVLTTRPPSGGAPDKILSRCTEILSDIEILTYIAPEHRLSEIDVQGVLAGIGDRNFILCGHLTTVMEGFHHQAARGQILEKSLYAYIDNIRVSNMNLQAVMDQQRTPEPQKYVNNNFKAKTATSTYGKSTVVKPKIPNTCHVCHSSHPGIRFYECPKLEAIQRRRDMLDESICNRCLKTQGNKSCTQGTCAMIGRFVVTCAIHPGPKARHFTICTRCPPGETVSPFPTQRVTQSMGVSVQKVQVTNKNEIAPNLANVARTGEVKLRSILYLIESIKILGPDGTVHKSVVLYDSAGGLSLLQEGLGYLDNFRTTNYSENLKVETLINFEMAQYPVRNINLICESTTPTPGSAKIPVQVVSLLLHECNFPITSPGPVLSSLKVKIKGEKNCLVPSPSDVLQLPTIVLGTHDLAWHPSILPVSVIPANIQKLHPGLQVFKSALTGKIILGGSITEKAHSGTTTPSPVVSL